MLDIFAALADPTRLRILALVRRMELAVGELAAVLRQSQPRVSRHVRILDEAGLVARAKEGAWVFVRLGEAERVGPVLAMVDALGEVESATAGDLARLAEVRAERAAAAEQWFAANADGWDALRTMHVADAEVEAAVVNALGDRPVGRLVDIGTGTGRMIELLGGGAAAALGIDRSPEMLRIARTRIEQAGLAAQVRQADMTALPEPDGTADTVVIHQVLHYAADPGAVVAEAARLLAPGGRLLVVDYAPHDREELRERFAHARLGFEDAAVCAWMERAGLSAEVVRHLRGGSLTVTIWRGERAAAPKRKAA